MYSESLLQCAATVTWAIAHSAVALLPLFFLVATSLAWWMGRVRLQRPWVTIAPATLIVWPLVVEREVRAMYLPVLRRSCSSRLHTGKRGLQTVALEEVAVPLRARSPPDIVTAAVEGPSWAATRRVERWF